MSKKNNTPLAIFAESIGLYFSNIDKFIKYMTFPVLGQIFGLGLILFLILFYTKNMPNLIEKFPTLNNLDLLITCAILITLPGLFIFTKAFWEYLVAYGAVNSMLENMLKSGRVYDFDAHTELIKRRSIPFIGLWFLFGIFSLISIVPFFWIPAGILAIYFVLTFQVFTYEPELTPINCVKKSILLIKGHFASTFMLMALAGSLTYILIPQLANKLFETTNISNFLSSIIIPFIQELPIEQANEHLLKPLNIDKIASFTVMTIISQIFIQYTLPLRSILWGIWYKELKPKDTTSQNKPKQKRSNKKPSEKLMEESHKKFAKKKIDKNILKRAMEKDD